MSRWSGDWDAYFLPDHFQIDELSLGILAVFAIMAFRFCFRFVSEKSAREYGEECHPQTQPPDCYESLPAPDREFLEKNILTVEEIMQKYSHLKEEQANEIFRLVTDKRRLQEAMHKFHDVAYKTVVCTCLTSFSVYLWIFKLHFFSDFTAIWSDCLKYPERVDGAQPFNHWMYIYYSVQFGYHLQGAILQHFDTIRKDFWAMLFHHWVTAALIVGSWAYRYMRTGAVVMAIHDNADMVLRMAKLAQYLKLSTLKDVLFLSFSLVWFVMRISIFSYFCYAQKRDAPPSIQKLDSFFVLHSLLLFLEVLHLYWFTFIGGALFRVFVRKEVIGDVRSMSESDIDGAKAKMKRHDD